MKISFKHLIPLMITSALWVALASGCNTIRGAGRDVERTGDHIQNATR